MTIQRFVLVNPAGLLADDDDQFGLVVDHLGEIGIPGDGAVGTGESGRELREQKGLVRDGVATLLGVVAVVELDASRPATTPPLPRQ